MSYKKFLQEPNFKHLDRLTSATGLWQHAKYEVPDPEFGFSIDDNARALIIMLKHWLIYKDPKALEYVEIYLDYLKRAKNSNGFHNFSDAKGNFMDKSGSPDSLGRTFWALCFTAYAKIEPFSSLAKKLIAHSEKKVDQISALRARAFVLIGYYYLRDKEKTKKLADELIRAFEKHHEGDWWWFEHYLTYSNALMCQALFYAYKLTKKKKYLEVAKLSFDFLLEVCQYKGKPAPIGQAGWFIKGQTKALYDQQAVDAGKMVSTSLLAYDITREKKYLHSAESWFGWFHKNNVQKLEMIDRYWGGCYDGITPKGVNKNMGAESTIAYLMAYLDFANLALKLEAR